MEDGIELASCGFMICLLDGTTHNQAFKFPTTPYAMDCGVYAWCVLRGGFRDASRNTSNLRIFGFGSA
jgi:hypothetical protein